MEEEIKINYLILRFWRAYFDYHKYLKGKRQCRVIFGVGDPEDFCVIGDTNTIISVFSFGFVRCSSLALTSALSSVARRPAATN